MDDGSMLDLQALLTGSQVAAYAEVSIQAVVNWRNRGQLPIATDPDTGAELRDGRGRPLYRLLDAAKADARARAGAEAMAAHLGRRAAA